MIKRLRLIDFGIAAEATVGKYVKMGSLLREVKILYAVAYVFAASGTSAARCSHTHTQRVGARVRGPGPPPKRRLKSPYNSYKLVEES